jgi:DHA1 family bicyclomycin/chloramphenicol resistance-like MFS transporter
MIGGMMLGAFLSGRLAGRLSAAQAAGLGFALCGLAQVYNLGYNLLVPEPGAPWAVWPIALNAVGISLVFPILTLAILDMYPRQRGSASSMQAFVGLNFNAILAGLVSPWASVDSMRLAMLAALSSALAWVLWRFYRRSTRLIPTAAVPGDAIEPIDRM